MKPASIFSSSIGKKLIVAVTGALLVLFIVGHLLGNLQLFLGQEAFNAYAALLHSKPALLWSARLGLIIVFLAHVKTTIELKLQNIAARPYDYLEEATVRAGIASRYMIHTGIIVLIFIILHLLHFTFGLLQPEFAALVDAQGRPDAYSMVVHGFQDITYSGIYLFCMLVLLVHLSHGISSVFQTLGLWHPRYTPLIEHGCLAFSILLALGYAAIPCAVLFGIITLPAGGM